MTVNTPTMPDKVEFYVSERLPFSLAALRSMNSSDLLDLVVNLIILVDPVNSSHPRGLQSGIHEYVAKALHTNTEQIERLLPLSKIQLSAGILLAIADDAEWFTEF